MVGRDLCVSSNGVFAVVMARKMVVFATAAVAAKLAVVADSDVVVRGTSFAEAWWSCGSAVKIENDGEDRESLFVNGFSSTVCDINLQEQKDKHVNETHQLPCLKRKLVHSVLLCIWSVDKSKFVKHNAWNYLLLHIKLGYCSQDMLSTDCNHWKVTNIKLNLILEEEN